MLQGVLSLVSLIKSSDGASGTEKALAAALAYEADEDVQAILLELKGPLLQAVGDAPAATAAVNRPPLCVRRLLEEARRRQQEGRGQVHAGATARLTALR